MPWKKNKIDFLFRSQEEACSDVPSAVAGSIGDRLLMVPDGDSPVEFPLTQPDARAAGFINAGPCWTDMGHHMIYPHLLHLAGIIGPVMALYSGDGVQLQGMNTPSLLSRSTPPFEDFDAKHGGPAHGLHVYFRDHKGSCGAAPTLAPFDAIAV